MSFFNTNPIAIAVLDYLRNLDIPELVMSHLGIVVPVLIITYLVIFDKPR